MEPVSKKWGVIVRNGSIPFYQLLIASDFEERKTLG